MKKFRVGESVTKYSLTHRKVLKGKILAVNIRSVSIVWETGKVDIVPKMYLD